MNTGTYKTLMDAYGEGSGARSRNRTGTTVKSQDFKSCVSTNFTIRAMVLQRRHALKNTYLVMLLSHYIFGNNTEIAANAFTAE